MKSHYLTISSVIIGLGITHLLSGYAHLIKKWAKDPEKRKEENYWLVHVWSVLIFLAMIQYWAGVWESLEYGNPQERVDMFGYLLDVSPLIILYLLAVLVLPSVDSSLVEHYCDYRRWFGTLATILPFTYIFISIFVLDECVFSDVNAIRFAYVLLYIWIAMPKRIPIKYTENPFTHKKMFVDEAVSAIALMTFLFWIISGFFAGVEDISEPACFF